MKIILVVPQLISFKSFLTEFARDAVDRGDQVVVVTDIPDTGVDTRSASSGARFISVPFPRGMNLFAHFCTAHQINKIIHSESPDIIQVHFSAATFTVALARRKNWPPVIATIQGMVFPLSSGAKKMLMRIAESFAFRRMNAVWVLTDDDYNHLCEIVGSKRAFRQRSPGFGCDLDHFQSDRVSNEERELLRNELGIPPCSFIFIFVGRKVYFKGYSTVIRAFLELDLDESETHLICVGPRDALHHTGLTEREARCVEACANIHEINYTEKVREFLTISNCMVFPSNREGMAVSLMEALAMCLPVITTKARGCGDVVRSGIDGWVLSENSVSSVKDAMRSAVLDPKQLEKFIQAAREGRSRFSRNKFVRENREIISSLVNSENPDNVLNISKYLF